VNEGVTSQFPGSTVQIGGTKRGENPTIPDEEGGELNKASGRYVSIFSFLLPPLPPFLLNTIYTARPSRCRWASLTFRQTKANEFEGKGGPEDKIDQAVVDRPGDQDVTANVR
jgi:hypothetical protein